MDNRISVCFPAVFDRARYITMLKALGGELCRGYGIAYPLGHKYTDEPVDRMWLTRIPTKVHRFVIPLTSLFLGWPKYYRLLYYYRTFDLMVAERVANDASRIVFTTTLLPRTIEACKKAGKTVVVEAGNSEPEMEHARIMGEYRQFGIKNMHIYGDSRFQASKATHFRMVDRIICISNVSMQTYLDAGIAEEMITMIPLTGCSWPVEGESSNIGKEKAFITTAFHSFIKGTHRLLLAWREACISDIPLIVVGEICEDMREFIDRYGPFDNVIFTGLLSQQQTRDLWYRYNACGVLLSLAEGAGRVIPEMMSYGFPMLVSQDATCDLVKNGVNGYIVEPTDTSAIADRLRWFAEDWSRVESMYNAVKRSVRKRTMEDYATEVADYLIGLL